MPARASYLLTVDERKFMFLFHFAHSEQQNEITLLRERRYFFTITMSHVKNVLIVKHEKVFSGAKGTFWDEREQSRSKYRRSHAKLCIDCSFVHSVRKSFELRVLG